MRYINVLATLGTAVGVTISFVPAPAHAVLMSQTLTYKSGPLSVLNAQTFNMFNTNLGTLTNVTLKLDGSASWVGSLKNNAAIASTGSYNFQTNFVLMGGTVSSFTQLADNSTYPGSPPAYTPGNSTLDAILRRNLNFNSGALGYGRRDTVAGNGATRFPALTTFSNFNVASGSTLSVNASDTLSTDDADNYGQTTLNVSLTGPDLAAFSFAGVSSDQITLNTLSFLSQTISGGAALDQTIVSSAGATLVIDYTYTAPPPPPPPTGTPEPASMAMLGMGLVGLGAAVRRRRRT